MKQVDFMCIGAAKSGTTWLFHHLNKHPEVFIPPIKELNFFNKHHPEYLNKTNSNYGKNIDWYHSYFKEAKPNQLNGDFSTSYLTQENCAKDIFKYNPKTKIIVILRKPTDRSFSHYLFLKQRGIVSGESFEQAAIKFPQIISNSLYAKHLLNYYNCFSSDQIKVIDFENIVQTPFLVFKELFSYLDIDSKEIDGLESAINETKNVRLRHLNPFLNKVRGYLPSGIINQIMKLNSVQNSDIPKLDQKTLNKLNNLFQKDYKVLTDITGLNFNNWFSDKQQL